MPDCPVPMATRPSGRGRLVIRRRTSITDDDDEFEKLARGGGLKVPVPPVAPQPPGDRLLLSPKAPAPSTAASLGVATELPPPSPRVLPSLRALRTESSTSSPSSGGAEGLRTPGSARGTGHGGLGSPALHAAATPPSGATPRRPAGGVGSPCVGPRPGMGAATGTPRGGGGAGPTGGPHFSLPTPRGWGWDREEEKKDDEGPSLSKRTRLEVGGATLCLVGASGHGRQGGAGGRGS